MVDHCSFGNLKIVTKNDFRLTFFVGNTRFSKLGMKMVCYFYGHNFCFLNVYIVYTVNFYEDKNGLVFSLTSVPINFYPGGAQIRVNGVEVLVSMEQ